MKISEFVKQLLDAQGKYGDIEIQTEYDGFFYTPRIKGVETSYAQYDGQSFEPKIIPTEPRLIIR